MTTPQTYQGVVRHGRIQLPPAATLPEGSSVLVWVAEQAVIRPLLDAHLARRKANGWLVTHVGRVMAQQPQLHQRGEQLVWRFKAFLATQGQPLPDSIGMVDVDAYEGVILNSLEDADKMVAHATTIISSSQTPKS